MAAMPLSVLGLWFLAGIWGLVHGSLHIPQCSAQGWLEVREDQASGTAIQCKGFSANQTVVWQLIENYTVLASSTCTPMPEHGICDTNSFDITGLRPINNSTTLIIKDNQRQLVGKGSVKCLVQGNSVESHDTCKTNVINPAVLSDCEVTTTAHRTLAGTCNFRNAYSSNGTYTCTWTLTSLDTQGPHDVITGGIHKTPYTVSGKLYYNGTCSFTRSGLPAGQYSYAVLFFPRSQYLGTAVVGVTGSSTVPSATTKNTRDQSSSSTAYIVGGVVAGVVVIVIIVVVVVLVRKHLGRRLYERPKRRRQRQPEEHPYTGLDHSDPARQTSHPTLQNQGSVQHEIPDQAAEPYVDMSQINPAFTPDTDDGYQPMCKASQPYENHSQPAGSPPASNHPYRKDYQPCSSSQNKENDNPPNSSHPYNNNQHPCPSSQVNGNDSAPDSSHPYKNDSLPDSSQLYENDDRVNI